MLPQIDNTREMVTKLSKDGIKVAKMIQNTDECREYGLFLETILNEIIRVYSCPIEDEKNFIEKYDHKWRQSK